MAREQIVNNAITYLSGAITDIATSIAVSDASAFPASGDFVIIVDDEIILVKSVSGDTFTSCVRGHEGSSNVAHDDGSVVAHILTAGSLLRHIRGSVPFFNDTNVPLVNYMVDDAGVILDASDFDDFNQGGSSLTNHDSGGVLLYIPAAVSNSVRVYKRAAPSTPFTVVAMVRGNTPIDGGMFGIAFRESTTGKMLNIGRTASGVVAQKWNDEEDYVGAVGTSYATFGGQIWVKLEDDGADLTCYVSHDGANWVSTFSEARGTFLTPDEIAIIGNDSDANAAFYATVHTWIEG